MTRFFIQRLIRMIITIWFILTLVFIFTRMSGDPTQWLLPEDASEAARIELRESLGLNKPIMEQYFDSFASFFDKGLWKSYYYLSPVADLFSERAGPTISVGLSALLLAILLGIPLGIFASVHRNSFLDRITMGFAIAGYTIPNFVLGILMILLFSLTLRLLPSGGFRGATSYIMPIISLSVGSMASIARLTRSAMLDVLRQDYLDCARAKGVPEHRIIFKHALRNALIPVVTIIGLQMGTIIGGSVVVETVFAWPGIGSLIVTAAKVRDYPVIQYGVMLIAVAVSITNMLVDISYALLDPRIRSSFNGR